MEQTPLPNMTDRITPPAPGVLKIGDEDHGWLRNVGCEVNSDTINTLQGLVNMDTEDLRVDDSRQQQAVSARGQFLEYIGIISTNSKTRDTDRSQKKIESKSSTLRPLKSLIHALRTYEAYGLSIQAIFNADINAIYHSHASIQQKMENLKQLGLDAVKVVNSFPVANKLPTTLRSGY